MNAYEARIEQQRQDPKLRAREEKIAAAVAEQAAAQAASSPEVAPSSPPAPPAPAKKRGKK